MQNTIQNLEYLELQNEGYYPKNNVKSIIFNEDKYTVHKNKYGKHLYVFDKSLKQWEICFDGFDVDDYGWSDKDITFLKKELGNFVTEINW
jgi:hypothetical protein